MLTILNIRVTHEVDTLNLTVRVLGCWVLKRGRAIIDGSGGP
jgi:hypothetical protein